jgi:PTS system beta-glucosides-specific IIC component
MINNLAVLGHDSMLPMLCLRCWARWGRRWGFSCVPAMRAENAGRFIGTAGIFGITEPAVYG